MLNKENAQNTCLMPKVGLPVGHENQSQVKLENRFISGTPIPVYFVACVGTTHAEKIKGFEIDHIKPHAAGGDSSIGNLQVLCRKCNNSKRHYRMQ